MKSLKIDETYGKRTIAVKDPQLRKIRNNFRYVWLGMAYITINNLRAEEDKVYFDNNGNFKAEISGEEIEKVKRISKKLSSIKELIDNSICKCHRCPRTDQDMIYNPRNGAWYCVKCYEEMHQWTAKKKTEKSLLFP